MTSNDITRALAHAFPPLKYTISARCCSALQWEADFLAVTKAGYLTEVEIKVSRSDFQAEFKSKAHKHRVLQEGVPKQGQWRHKTGYDLDWTTVQPHRVKHFYFAMPHELATQLEPLVPTYCGLVAISTGGRFGALKVKVLRPAPILKNHRKLTQEEIHQIMRSNHYRYCDALRSAK
jgi:hypothetical protein